MNLLAPSRAPLIRFDRATVTRAALVQLPVFFAIVLLVVVSMLQLQSERRTLADLQTDIAQLHVPNDKAQLARDRDRYNMLLDTINAQRVGEVDTLVAARDINNGVASGVTITKISSAAPVGQQRTALFVEGTAPSTSAIDASRRNLERMQYHVSITSISRNTFHAMVTR